MWGNWMSAKCKQVDDIIYKTEQRNCVQGNCVGENEVVKYNESCDGLFQNES